MHARHKNIDWKITGLLSLGSVPAAALTLWFLNTLHTDTSALNAIIKQGLAVVLILTALAILFKSRLQLSPAAMPVTTTTSATVA